MKSLILKGGITFCLFLMFLLISFSIQGQSKYYTKSKKAVKKFEKALTAFDQRRFDIAIKELNKAIKADKDFIEAHLLKADIYSFKDDYAKQIEAYKKVVEIKPDYYPLAFLNLADAEKNSGLYADAKQHYEMLYKFRNKPKVSKYLKDAKKGIKSCEFAINAIDNPVPFDPKNLGENINSENDEYLPALTLDEKTLIVTVRLPLQEKNPYIDGALGSMMLHEDFFFSNKKNDVWVKVKNMGKPINTTGNEGAQSVSADGNYLFFTACDRPDGKGRCDIYYTMRHGNKWTRPANLGKPVNTSAWESQPSFSSDGRTLYFVSNRKGGFGGKDIWYSKLNENGYWDNPVNLGANVNTKGEEMSPFIHHDNQTLYFASDGHVGMGNYDLYVVRKKADGTWGKPKNLGYPINTFKDENSLIVNAKGNTAYFSSDRFDGGFGKMDLYKFELYEAARPNIVSYITGTIYDANSHTKLTARFELIDLKTSETIAEAFSDPITGRFLISLPAGRDYAFNVSHKNYLFYSENFSLKKTTHDKPYEMNIPLQPIRSGRRMVLKNVFFDVDSYKLKETSFVELNRLFSFLKNNKTIKGEIGGHTDNTGNEADNVILSQNRAKSVYDYLIKKGISSNRISYKGYGWSVPIVKNDTEENKAKNRRTEFKIMK